MPIGRSLDGNFLSAVAGFTVAALMLLAGIGFTMFEADEYRSQKLNEIKVQTQMLAANAAASLDFGDAQASQETLNTLFVNPEIEQAAIYNGAGALVAKFSRSDAPDVPDSVGSYGATYSGDSIAVFDRVQRNGRSLGAVYVRAMTEPLTRRIPRYVAVILLFAMASLALSVLVVSQRKLARTNTALIAEQREREKVEEALRQSQKMEAIGQLTGGIAHDFNNMLAMVIGSLSLLLRRAKSNPGDVVRYAETAMEGANRAATLTQQLLAFARRQPLSPVTLNPNKLVSGMTEILSRTVGEHIRFETVGGAGVWAIHADQSQLETALLNLVLNARDAMPKGGVLTIETTNTFLDEAYVLDHENVAAGQYVLISVTDTGTGMSKEVAGKVFEPFFTTKDVGKGTGLGLSQVYGFMKQSRGHVKIYSEPGHGTSVKLYLPRAGNRADAGFESRPRIVPPGNGHEIILVVEDEERVRRVTVETLRELGYTVRHAAGVHEALRILETQPDVDLLFTDIVMPDGNGRGLADEVNARWPGIKVLFTTGYTRNAVVHNGVLDIGVDLIMKPFTVEQLATKVREVLSQATATKSAK